MYRNKVRIIGGEWRRRQLGFPDGEGLRPTPDRVRETLFNWLGQEMTGMACLDLFAGSGALGFEAASRGAKQVTMVELSRTACKALAANKELLRASTIHIVAGEARRFLENDRQVYDLVFIDPPFNSTLAAELMPLLKHKVRESGWLYLECASLPDLEGWTVYRQGKAGVVQYLLLQKG